jgi:hypothetical protein
MTTRMMAKRLQQRLRGLHTGKWKNQHILHGGSGCGGGDGD